MDRHTPHALESALAHEADVSPLATADLDANQAVAGVRTDLVLRCKAMIEDGLYETESRVEAAVERLSDELA